MEICFWGILSEMIRVYIMRSQMLRQWHPQAQRKKSLEAAEVTAAWKSPAAKACAELHNFGKNRNIRPTTGAAISEKDEHPLCYSKSKNRVVLDTAIQALRSG